MPESATTNAYQGQDLAFWRVVGPPPWVAEGELRVASRASRLLGLIIVRSSLLGPGVDT